MVVDTLAKKLFKYTLYYSTLNYTVVYKLYSMLLVLNHYVVHTTLIMGHSVLVYKPVQLYNRIGNEYA